MSNFLGLWPVKSFFAYVFKRSFGKFLKNKIDFDKYDFSQKKITFRDLDLNTQMINENLKDSPFKVINVTISSVQVNNPSLNLITQKINIEIHNIDVILMPVLNVTEEKVHQSISSDSDSESNKDEMKNDSSQKQSEEFNDFEPHRSLDIPTFLLRLTNIEYKRQACPDPNTRPISDIQVILDGKILEVSEVSLHLMRNYILKQNDQKSKQNSNHQQQNLQQQQKLKFPIEYPQINDPSTILVIKPSLSQQMTGKKSALSVQMSFPNDVKRNRLDLKAELPNIEALLSFDQLKRIVEFSQDLQLYIRQKEGRVPCMTQSFFHKPNEIDEDTLDLYGTIIKDKLTNKDQEPGYFIKYQQRTKASTNVTKPGKKKKPLIKTEKIICGYLKATTKKNEFAKLKDDLRQSMMQSRFQSSQNSDDLKNQMDGSLIIDQSQYQSINDISARKQPLSITASFALGKLSLIFILNESGISYDNVYDCIPTLNQQQNVSQMMPFPPGNLVQDDNHLLRLDQKIGYCHYNLEARSLNIDFSLKHLKRRDNNPFTKRKLYSQMFKLKGGLGQLQLNRYDLQTKIAQPNNQIGLNQFYQLDSSTAQYESFSQNSAMFQSAQEFYKLEQTNIYNTLYDSKNLEKSNVSHKRHGNNGGQSHINQQSQCQVAQNLQDNQYHTHPIYFQNMFKLNSHTQHFCRQSIVDFRSISKGETNMMASVQLSIQEEKNSKLKLSGEVRFGVLNVNFGYPEVILIGQIAREISTDKIRVEKKPVESKVIMDRFDVSVDFIKIDVLNSTNNKFDLKQKLGLIIENNPIENLQPNECYCQQQAQASDITAQINIRNASLQAKASKIQILLEGAELVTIDQLNSIQLINLQTISVLIETNILPSLQKFHNDEYNTYMQHDSKAIIVFEDQIETIDDEEEESKNEKQNKKNYYSDDENCKTLTKVSINVKKLNSDILVDQLEQIVFSLVKLEEMFKFLSLFEDIARAYAYEKTKEKENFPTTQFLLQNRRKKAPISTIINLEVNDLQILISRNISNIQAKLLDSNCIQVKNLLKIRLDQIQAEIQLGISVKQDRFLIKSTINQLMLIDYLQTPSKFHQTLINREVVDINHFNQDQNIQRKQDNLREYPAFIDELMEFQDKIIIYKQQGISQPFIMLNIEAVFQKKKLFKELITSDNIANLYIKALEMNNNNQILQLNEDLLQIKRNPMELTLSINVNALLIRLTMDYNIVLEMLQIEQAFGKIIKKYRVAPQVQISAQDLIKSEKLSSDQIHLTVELSDIAIDYQPILHQQKYEMFYNDNFLSLNISKLDEKATHYIRSLQRGILYLGDLKAIYQKKEKLKLYELSVRNVGLHLLQQNSINSNMNPILLLDKHKSINSQGGQSYLDYLGFIQVFSLNLVELRYKIKKIVQVKLKSPTTINEQLAAQDAQTESLKQITNDKIDDLYQTTFGEKEYIPLLSQIDSDENLIYVKKEKLRLQVKKISLYLANDSFQTFKKLIQVIQHQTQEIIKKVEKLQNKEPKEKKNVHKIYKSTEDDEVEKILSSFFYIDQHQQDEENKEFIGNKDLPNQNCDLSVSQLEDDNIGANQYENHVHQSAFFYQDNSKSQIGSSYFKIEQDGNDKQLESSGILNIETIIQDEFIQVITDEKLQQIKHRKCHIVPEQFRELFKSKNFYFEIECIDLKLFQGKDFDFEQKQNYQAFYSRELSQKIDPFTAISSSQLIADKVQDLTLSIQEDYLAQNYNKIQNQKSKINTNQSIGHSQLGQSQYARQPITQNKFQLESQKRPRKSGRGFYFSLQLKNIVFSYYRMRDYNDYEKMDNIYENSVYSIQNIAIKETISRKGRLQRELLQIPYSYQYDNHIEFSYFYITQKENDEIGIKLQIQPFKLMLNQKTITFFQEFFEIDFTQQSSQPNPKNFISTSETEKSQGQFSEYSDSNQRQVFISQLKIVPFQAVFTYTSNRLNFKDLKDGSKLEFLNIFNINDLKINIKGYELQQKILKDKALKNLLEFYKEDLTQNQKINFFKAIGPVRSVFNIAGALYGVVKKPYQGFYSEKGVFKGFGEGFYNLYNVVTEESFNFTNKVRQYAVKLNCRYLMVQSKQRKQQRKDFELLVN
ncbi:UNKNOWN [Stylonychia lemnae]|uniref:Autophagy-related protein 2 n=1 Tax=Stylonychia lemnae TaxID=5949 RepID=A0A078B266_STYLE|nr:UNKNOWN [Stylonychia lemnae]|eukprot:CDW87518.1 UNKNOWN [Stylonychia lemnae]